MEIPVVVAAPDHPTYSRPRISGQTTTTTTTGATQPQTTTTGTKAPTNPVAGVAVSPPAHEHAPTGTQNPPAAAPTVNPPASQTVHERPATPPPTSAPREVPKVEAPRVEPPKVEPPKVDSIKGPDKKGSLLAPAERNLYQQVLADFYAPVPKLSKNIQDLDAWARAYPNSSLANERQYYYVLAYNSLGQPERVLEAAEQPVAAGARVVCREPDRIMQLLLVTTSSLQKLREPSSHQLEVGRSAARQLLDYLPEYFQPQHKPANLNDGSWNSARAQLESLGKLVLARKAAALHAER
jgi:hypothetical protein